MVTKIAIIGAGPGGLTLARILQRNGIICTVYEGEPCRSSRNQGGTLDLHPNTGQLALAKAGLAEEFKKHSRTDAEVMKLLAPDGTVLWDENVMGNWRPKEYSDRPEIDRTVLRDILLDSLEPGTVRWNHKVDRVEAESGLGGKHTVYLTNGTSESNIDLLVGADGAFSKVRKLLTDVEPQYSGITGIELWQTNVDEENPWLSKQIGEGSCFMSDKDRALLCQRQGNGNTRAYACLRVPINWIDACGINWSDRDTARRTLAEKYFGDCGDDIKRMILESKNEVIPRRAYMLPVGLKWKSQPGVTVIGDAAHLMTPFAGVGVNLAMAGALKLAEALIARRDSLFAKAFSDNRNISIAIQEYEKIMFFQAERFATKTWDALVERFTEGSSLRRAEQFRKHYEMMKDGKGNLSIWSKLFRS